MPDWKEMYLTLMRDTERAIRILEASQQKCEELYLQSPQAEVILLPRQDAGTESSTET